MPCGTRSIRGCRKPSRRVASRRPSGLWSCGTGGGGVRRCKADSLPYGTHGALADLRPPLREASGHRTDVRARSPRTFAPLPLPPGSRCGAAGSWRSSDPAVACGTQLLLSASTLRTSKPRRPASAPLSEGTATSQRALTPGSQGGFQASYRAACGATGAAQGIGDHLGRPGAFPLESRLHAAGFMSVPTEPPRCGGCGRSTSCGWCPRRPSARGACARRCPS